MLTSDEIQKANRISRMRHMEAVREFYKEVNRIRKLIKSKSKDGKRRYVVMGRVL